MANFMQHLYKIALLPGHALIPRDLISMFASVRFASPG